MNKWKPLIEERKTKSLLEFLRFLLFVLKLLTYPIELHAQDSV